MTMYIVPVKTCNTRIPCLKGQHKEQHHSIHVELTQHDYAVCVISIINRTVPKKLQLA